MKFDNVVKKKVNNLNATIEILTDKWLKRVDNMKLF